MLDIVAPAHLDALDTGYSAHFVPHVPQALLLRLIAPWALVAVERMRSDRSSSNIASAYDRTQSAHIHATESLAPPCSALTAAFISSPAISTFGLGGVWVFYSWRVKQSGDRLYVTARGMMPEQGLNPDARVDRQW